MRKILLIIALASVVGFGGCQKEPVGYLNVEEAAYGIDEMTIIPLKDVTLESNEALYKLHEKRITNKAPWVTSEIEGVLGTDPLTFTIESVKVIGRGDTDLFMSEVSIIGGGRIMFPFDYKSPKGFYSISIRITNEGYSKVLKDAFNISLE